MSARYLAGQVFCTLGAPEPSSTFFIYIIDGIPKNELYGHYREDSIMSSKFSWSSSDDSNCSGTLPLQSIISSSVME